MPHRFFLLSMSCLSAAWAQMDYDLVLKGGHEIDSRSRLSAVRDVAIQDGRMARVADRIPAGQPLKPVDVSGLRATPGLIDIHAHVLGRNAIQPDGFTFRVGVTTAAASRGAGWS